MIAWGGFLEGRRWALSLEVARLGLLAAVGLGGWLVGAVPAAGAVAAMTFSALMGAWLLRQRSSAAVVSVS
jgi:hypothetical protein